MIKRILFTLFLSANVTLIFAQKANIPLYIGTYTTSDGSQGVYEFSFDTQSGNASLHNETKTSNPSFLARNSKFLLAANELTDGNQSLSSFEITADGLKFINKVGTDGSAPCHVVLSKDSKYAVVSNYLGGALNLFSLSGEGRILQKEDTKLYNGSSIDKSRQEASHIHSAFFGPDGLLYVSDLGADKIYILGIEKNAAGKIAFTEKGELSVRKGGGPRHIAFHPNGKFLYALMEMSGDIEVFKKNGSSWKFVQRVSMRDPNFKGQSGAADLKLSADGKFLYSTDRIDANTITVFSVAKNGILKQIQVTSVLGKGPRNFNFSPNEKFILVANQLSDEVVVFNRNQTTGKLSDSGNRIKAFKPVCVLF